jgi:S-DNA-T family DNA segregation ATPase FtsK/SpoIIIE
MYEEDQEKIEKFFYMMEQIMDERKKTFNGGSYAQYVALNPNTMPAILIVIDNIGAFHGKMNDKYDNRLLRLSKEGINYGIFLAISAAGFQNTEIPIKMGDNIKTVVGLQLTDKYAYMDALHSTNIDVLPENGVKGRGLVRVGDDILEFQTALAQKAEDDFKRLSQIDMLCLQMKDAWKQKSAREIPVVPDKPVWGEFEQRSDVQKMYENGCYLPIGYDMASAGVYGIDMSKTFIYLISGRARAGKTNTLKAILRSASHMNGEIAVIELDGVNLKGTAAAVGADYIDTEQKQADYFNGLVKMFQERNAKKRRLVEDGFDDLEIYDAMKEFEPLFIVIKDIASFVSTVTSPKGDILKIANFVQNIAEKGRLHNVFIFAGINPDTAGLLMGTKLYDSMVGYHVGLHLGSVTSNIRYLDFSNISYAELNKMQKTGVALIPAGNEEATDKIMIPFVKGVERRTVEENV